ncbi:MAG: FkbM family methyltransferase [Schwartzia sp.]|nr:FkbM family methyltransferase [Schwartzia sp. (in: firmicutes)]
MENMLADVYERLGDEESRRLFTLRVMYCVTGNKEFAREMGIRNPIWQGVLKLMDENKGHNYLFGAGAFGRDVLSYTPRLWEKILDNNESLHGNMIGGVAVALPDSIRGDKEARAYIAARKSNMNYQAAMLDQLHGLGVGDEQIIRLDEVVAEMEGKQYFDLPYLENSGEEVFVDAGCFDGRTSLEFAKWAKKYRHIYCFEPSAENRKNCKKNLSSLPKDKWTLIPKGAWNKSEMLHFHEDFDSSSLSDEGEIEVPVASIDDELRGKGVTFIKMDIEGAESKALEGARMTIKNDKPKLAICVYHRKEDIVDIPRQILSYNDEYRFYLRHYTFWGEETVLYAI